MRVRALPLVLLVAVVATACRPEAAPEATVARVVVFQDGSSPDARAIVSPGVLGLQAGLGGILGMEVLEVGGSAPAAITAEATASASDPSVVAAVIAPFTAMPDEAVDALRSGGVSVLSLSSFTPVPRGRGAPWRSFVASIPTDAGALAARADALRRPGTALCVGGTDDGAWSASLAAALARRTPRLPPPGPTPRAVVLRGSPSEVAAAIGRARECGVLVWVGTADGAVALRRALDTASHGPILFLADRARTPGFLQAAGPIAAGARLVGACACADVSTAGDPAADRFLHDYQAATGLDPGPFAAEGWDIGRFVARIVGIRGPSRAEVAAAVEASSRAPGVGGAYTWNRSGALTDPRVRSYRSVGWRWLSLIVPPGVSGGRPASSRGGQS